MRSFLAAAALTTVALTAVALSAYGVSAAPPAPNLGALAGKPIVQVQGRACRACRRDCYGEFRIACGYSQSCRTAFTQCMRGCWEDYCR